MPSFASSVPWHEEQWPALRQTSAPFELALPIIVVGFWMWRKISRNCWWKVYGKWRMPKVCVNCVVCGRTIAWVCSFVQIKLVRRHLGNWKLIFFVWSSPLNMHPLLSIWAKNSSRHGPFCAPRLCFIDWVSGFLPASAPAVSPFISKPGLIWLLAFGALETLIMWELVEPFASQIFIFPWC